MTTYINNTRSESILTINIESSENLKEALHLSEPGNKDVYLTLTAGLGINDIDVPAGKEVRVANNTVATFLAVRSAN